MIQSSDTQSRGEAAPANDPPADRRRPGRTEDVNPALLPLLRRESLLPAPGVDVEQDDDDLAPARGVAVSVLIGALLWIGIAVAACWLLLT